MEFQETESVGIESPQLLSTDEGYLLEVEEAASLLRVSRTRLSQLTSKGVFSYQRRKIGVRNRLFYKRTEILSYIRRQMGTTFPAREEISYNPRSAAAQFDSGVEASSVQAINQEFEQISTLAPKKHVRQIIPVKKMPSALELKRAETRDGEIVKLQNALTDIAIMVNQHLESADFQELRMKTVFKELAALQKTFESLRVRPSLVAAASASHLREEDSKKAKPPRKVKGFWVKTQRAVRI